MGPMAESDGHDAPRLIDELVPCVAAVIDDIVVRFEDAVREIVVAQELPDILGWIEFRAFGRQRQERDIRWNDELVGHMPASLVEKQHGMSARRDVLAISARCRSIAKVLQRGKTRAAPLPSFGEIAPKI